MPWSNLIITCLYRHLAFGNIFSIVKNQPLVLVVKTENKNSTGFLGLRSKNNPITLLNMRQDGLKSTRDKLVKWFFNCNLSVSSWKALSGCLTRRLMCSVLTSSTVFWLLSKIVFFLIAYIVSSASTTTTTTDSIDVAHLF